MRFIRPGSDNRIFRVPQMWESGGQTFQGNRSLWGTLTAIPLSHFCHAYGLRAPRCMEPVWLFLLASDQVRCFLVGLSPANLCCAIEPMMSCVRPSLACCHLNGPFASHGQLIGLAREGSCLLERMFSFAAARNEPWLSPMLGPHASERSTWSFLAHADLGKRKCHLTPGFCDLTPCRTWRAAFGWVPLFQSWKRKEGFAMTCIIVKGPARFLDWEAGFIRGRAKVPIQNGDHPAIDRPVKFRGLKPHVQLNKTPCSTKGPPVVPFYPFSGEGSPTKMDYRKRKKYPCSNLKILEDLANQCGVRSI